MSSFTCDTCGMVNLDCRKEGYKTPREIDLENLLQFTIETLKFYSIPLAVYDPRYNMAQYHNRACETLEEITRQGVAIKIGGSDE